MTRKFHDLRLEALVQATEDPNKVREALINLLGRDDIGKWDVSDSQGVHGNPIRLILIDIGKQREIREVLDRFMKMDFWVEALETMEERLDEDNVFHLRVDKGSAYLDDIRLWSSGGSVQIRLKLATYPSSREGSLDILREML